MQILAREDKQVMIGIIGIMKRTDSEEDTKGNLDDVPKTLSNI